jgi:4-hydroxy-L-threonine phosphate dehydrogenase PdxA
VEVWNVPLAVPGAPGRLDPANARAVLDMLAAACDGCAAGTFDALVTAPVPKSVLLVAGFAVRGRTELWGGRGEAARVGVGGVVVVVLGGGLGEARAHGLDVTGPLPADTIFVPQHAQAFDAIVAMYHDQGLPVLKSVSFGHGVNVTLGLPFVRTSVDHGTALDLAADPAAAARADPGSLVAAVDLAMALAHAGRR